MRYNVFIIIFILIFIALVPLNSFCAPENSAYTSFLKSSDLFNIYNIEFNDFVPNFFDVLDKITNVFFSEFKNIFDDLSNLFITLLLIIIMLSVSDSFFVLGSIRETVIFSSYIFCTLLICKIFDIISSVGAESIHSIREYMNVSFPAFVTILSGMGYNNSSFVMRSVYIIFSNISAIAVDSIIVPSLYISAILAISSGVSYSKEVRKFSKIIIKICKFVIGIMLIFFTSVITFSGLASSASDNIMIKTAKLAVTNFVPLVGSCLSDTLNSIVHTSVLLKNTAGYIGMIVIIMIVLGPILKFFVASILFRILSLLASFISDETLSEVFDVCGNVLSVYGSVLIFITLIYILMFGIIATMGI